MKPKHQEIHIMSASPAHYRKPATRCVIVITPFLRHLNPGTLALVMFVALALFSRTHGKDAETKESAPAKAATSEVIIKAGQRTILDLDLGEKGTLRRIAHN
jgi:hypothetical protein